MKSKSLVLLAVAAGCGLVAMLGVQQMLSRGGKTVETAKVQILVAKTDIDPGVMLDKTMVGFRDWPKDAVPEGAITKDEEYVERALKHRAGPGQPILSTELGKKGEFGLEVQIPVGMTVVTYPATATMTHSGLLKPGTFVDVYAAIEYPQKGGGKRTEVKPVLQCIQVIAVGSQVAGTEAAVETKGKDDKNVSFLVYPLQGQLLQLAYKKSNGAVQLNMRGRSDKTLSNPHDLSETSMSMMSNKLLGETDEGNQTNTAANAAPDAKMKSSFNSFVKRPTSPAVAAVGDQAVRRTWKIEVFQGDKREVQEIDWPDETVANAGPAATDSTKSGWSNPLMQFFSGRPKSGGAAPSSPNAAPETKRGIESRPSSFVKRTPETNPETSPENSPEEEPQTIPQQ